MIFNVPGHIEMIRNGLRKHQPISFVPPRVYVKTQTRRTKRGIYQVEAERKKPHKIGYAVQHNRGVKAEPDIRIVMDKIWKENCFKHSETSEVPFLIMIVEDDAWAEGGYAPEEYEKIFRELNPKWGGWSRWVFEFHVIEVKDKC